MLMQSFNAGFQPAEAPQVSSLCVPDMFFCVLLSSLEKRLRCTPHGGVYLL